ncbi:MAG: hygromycin-B 7-O-kinase [Actinomycetota bacterium]|nr:hygromycin-B 7-O-kinase [Actinomycetota bacterium]
MQEACDRFDLGALESAELPSAGLWGQNIVLTTSHGRFVFRGSPTVPTQFRRERAVAAALAAGGLVPVPWPYRLSEDPGLFGWSYAIMPMLPGNPGSTFWEACDEDDRLLLAAAHGDALGRLHRTEFHAPGPYDADADAFVAVDDFRAWTLDRIEDLRAGCRDADALDAPAEQYIDATIDACVAGLDERLTPVMVHHDFSLANTNYQRTDASFDFTGLFDLGEAHIGDGEEDLVRFLFRRKRAERDAFVGAYRERRTLRAGSAQRVTLYALADFLFMWQVSARVTNWFGDSSFVEAASRVIDTVQDALRD